MRAYSLFIFCSLTAADFTWDDDEMSTWDDDDASNGTQTQTQTLTQTPASHQLWDDDQLDDDDNFVDDDFHPHSSNSSEPLAGWCETIHTTRPNVTLVCSAG